MLAGLALAFAPSEGGYGPARVVVAIVLAALVGGIVVLLSARLRRWLGLGRLFGRLPFQTLLAEARRR